MWTDSVVFISNKNCTRFGTGFAIFNSYEYTYILTCLHVISDIGGIEQLRVDGQEAFLEAEGNESDIDLAILKVSRNLINKLPIPICTKVKTEKDIETFGFYQYGKKIMAKPLEGEFETEVNISALNIAKRIKAWNLKIKNDHQLQKGYSGSPVVEKNSKFAIAIISDREGDGKKGLAISIDALNIIWKDMPNELATKLALPLAAQHKEDEPSFKSNSTIILDPTLGLSYEVARIYKLLGGHVETFVSEGVELGFCSTFQTGPMVFRALVSCKTSTHDNLINDNDIKDFKLKFNTASNLGQAQIAVFVTNCGFHPEALILAKTYNFQCLTLEELYNQLVDFSEYSQKFIADFEQSDLNKWYIQQTGSDIEDYNLFEQNGSEDYLHHPIEDYVDDIFYNEQEKRLAILGNFGTGKSSFCQKYCQILMNRYLIRKSQRIPILLNLREYRTLDIQQVITDHLQKLVDNKINLNLCIELQKMGRFFFILDGLDEMAAKVDQVVIKENLREIERLHTEGRNIYLITCRTHFFQEKISDEILKDYRVIYLTEWGPSDIEEYLQKRFPIHYKNLYNQIMSTPSLVDLSRTPLLLDMILRSLSQISEDSIDTLNIYKLYEIYVDEWIVKQSNRRGAIMNSTQRRKFVELLAIKMYEEERGSLYFSDLYAIAREFCGYGDATKLDYFDSDARTCTFITKDSNGNYRFQHTSFMEFFCAKSIAYSLERGESKLLENKTLTVELIRFIEGIKLSPESIEKLNLWSKKFEFKVLSENATKILICKGMPLPLEVKRYYYNISDSIWGTLYYAINHNDNGSIADFITSSRKELISMIYMNIPTSSYSRELVEDILQDLYIKILAIPGRDVRFVNESGLKHHVYILARQLVIERLRINVKFSYETIDNESRHIQDIYDIQDIYFHNEIVDIWDMWDVIDYIENKDYEYLQCVDIYGNTWGVDFLEIKERANLIWEIMDSSSLDSITKLVFKERFLMELPIQMIAYKHRLSDIDILSIIKKAKRYIIKEFYRTNEFVS